MNWHLHTGDCLNWLPTIPRRSVELAFGDPPFNIGYEYDAYNDRRSREDYLAWSERWMGLVHERLTPTGTFWLAISDENAAELCLIAKRHGFVLRNWIVWHYTFGAHLKSKFGRSKTHLLYFTMNDRRFTWNADPVRIPSARQRTGDQRADPRGRVPSDVWIESRVCGTFHERTDHPCQMPESVLRRIVLSTSDPGDRVLDPFAGSGTTLAVAVAEGRTALGCELSAEYAEAARERIRKLIERREAVPMKPKMPWEGKSHDELLAYGVDYLRDAKRQTVEAVSRIDIELGLYQGPVFGDWRRRAFCARKHLIRTLDTLKAAIRTLNIRRDNERIQGRPEVRKAFDILRDLLDSLDGYDFGKDPKTLSVIEEGQALRNWRDEPKGGETE